ncbi:MAG: hypothetical protein IT445_00840 [Phycisphaeraceae bacterium]|nr:hypothetical protein [Phycisphaeraceae bacterium]
MPGQWLQKIETFIIVTVISVLVWLYADAQNVDDYTQQIRIKLVAPANQNLIIEPNVISNLTITYRASNSQQRQFDYRYREHPLQIEVSLPPADSPRTRPLDLFALVRDSAIKDLGLNLQLVSPPEQTVHIEQLVDVALPVVPYWDDDLELANVQIPELEKATVSLPQSMAGLVKNAAVIAPLSAAQMTAVKEGIPETRTVQLTLAQSVLDKADDFQKSNFSINPKSANVTFTLQSKNESYTIRRISIDYRVSPVLLRQFDLQIPTEALFLTDVVVNGPSKEIEKIIKGDFKVGAYIRPTSESLQNPSNDNQVSFIPQLDLPPGVVTVTPIQPVKITATPRMQP